MAVLSKAHQTMETIGSLDLVVMTYSLAAKANTHWAGTRIPTCLVTAQEMILLTGF